MPTGGDATEMMETTSDSVAKAPLLRPPAPGPAVAPLHLEPRAALLEQPPAEAAPAPEEKRPALMPPPMPFEPLPARLPGLNWKDPPPSHTARNAGGAGVVLPPLARPA